MRIIFGLVALSFAFNLSCYTALADDIVPDMSYNDAPVAEMVEAWTVEPFSRVNGVPSGECIMSADYSNGFELAFKGKNNRLTAIRVTDVDANDAAKVSGFIGLGIGDNSYGLQSKSREGQVDASLLTVPAAGEILKDSPNFRLRIGTTDYIFSTAGFDAGYDRLLACQRQYGLTTLKVVDGNRLTIVDPDGHDPVPSLPAVKSKPVESSDLLPTPPDPDTTSMEKGKNSMPLAMALPMLLPTGYTYQFDGTVNAMAPVSWDAKGDWQDRLKQAMTMQGYSVDIQDKNVKISSDLTPVAVASLRTVPPLGEDNVKQDDAVKSEWRAKKGDQLIATLESWAADAGVDTDIQLDKNPALEQDFYVSGSFEMAVDQLLNRVSAGTPIKPTAMLQNADGDMTHVSGYQGGMMDRPAILSPVTTETPNRWRALEGTDLRKVLQRWSAEEGIDFIWNTDRRFLVRQSVKTTTNYADAVALILSQYDGQDVKPKAILNTDPQTGKKALVIQIDG